MKVRFLPLAIFALLLVQAVDVFAQATPLEPEKKGTPIYVGPVIGYNRSIHSVSLASFVADPLCPFFSNGTSNGFFGGISAEYLLGNPVNSKSSIIARVLYNSMPASFTKDGDRYPSLVESQGSYTTVYSRTRHTLDVSYSFATVEVMYKLNLFETTFGICAGPTFDIPLTKKIQQVYEIVEPLNVQFKRPANWQELGYKYENSDRKIIVMDQDIAGANSFRIGLRGGVIYEILVGRMYIVPGIFYDKGITKLSSKDDWFVDAFQAELDVRFSL